MGRHKSKEKREWEARKAARRLVAIARLAEEGLADDEAELAEERSPVGEIELDEEGSAADAQQLRGSLKEAIFEDVGQFWMFHGRPEEANSSSQPVLEDASRREGEANSSVQVAIDDASGRERSRSRDDPLDWMIHSFP